MPGAEYKPKLRVSFVLTGDVTSFDEAAFVARFRTQFPGTERVVVTVAAASVRLDVTCTMASHADAGAVRQSLEAVSPSVLSQALAVPVASIGPAVVATERVDAPSPPPAPPREPPLPAPLSPSVVVESGVQEQESGEAERGGAEAEVALLVLLLVIVSGVNVGICAWGRRRQKAWRVMERVHPEIRYAARDVVQGAPPVRMSVE